jgi:hypothetical protein
MITPNNKCPNLTLSGTMLLRFLFSKEFPTNEHPLQEAGIALKLLL